MSTASTQPIPTIQRIASGSYGIHSDWKLRLATYAGYGTYVEAWSDLAKKWVVVKRINR